MANVKFILAPVGVTNKIIMLVEKVNDLGTTVYGPIVFNPVHTQRNITVPDMDPVMLRFFFWESADGVALDTLLGSADIDGALATEPMIMIYEFTVGEAGPTDPADLSDTYVNADLIGADLAEPGVDSTSTVGVYVVQQKGVSFKNFDELQNNPLTGGFTLLNGDKFSEADKWLVTLFRKVVPAPVAAQSGFPSDIVEIPALVTVMDGTHLGKELVPTNAGNVQTFQLMDLTAVADGKYFAINTHKFTGRYVYLDFSAGGSLWYRGAEVTSFWIPADEVVSFQVKGHKLHIVIPPLRGTSRGDIIGSYVQKRGYILANGTSYTKAENPGLYDFALNLPVGVAVSFADWDLLDVDGNQYNRGRWALDVGTQSIIVPNLVNLHRRFLMMAADPERPENQPGSYQGDRVGPYTDTQGDHGTTNTVDTYNGGGFHFKTKVINAGKETRGKNFGEIPLITL